MSSMGSRYVLSLAALLLCLTSLAEGYPTFEDRHSNIFLDIALCARRWKAQTPPDLHIGLESLPKSTDVSNNYGLQYLLLLEPYLTYLLTLNNQDDNIAVLDYEEVFENYCKEDIGIDFFISCVKQSKSYQSDLNLASGKTRHNTDILENLRIRYCNSSGGVNELVLAALRQDATSEEIKKLARHVDPKHANGSILCSEVIEALMPALTQLFTEGNVRIKAFFSLIERAIETFTRCLMVSVSPNEKALVLKEHLEMVLLKLIDSNIADVTRVEMSVARQTVSMAGYSNVLHRGKGHQTCSSLGTRMLLDNSHMKVEGVLLYDRKNNNLPYLAAVHIEFPLYNEETLRHIGEITYSSGMEEPLETELVTWWRSDTADQMARVSTYDHGIIMENSLKSEGAVEITDLRTGTYIALSREGSLLTIVVRMFTTFLYQSTGVLLENCNNNGHTPAYHVMRTSKECRKICHVPFTGDIKSMCQKDCLMSDNALQLGAVYKSLEAMRGVAELKDDLIEEMSAIENEPEVPGDEAVTYQPLHTVQYEPGLEAVIKGKDLITLPVTTTTLKPSTKPKKVRVTTTPKKLVTKRSGLPAELASAPGSGTKAMVYDTVLMCICVSLACLLFIDY